MRIGTAPITWGVAGTPGWGMELPYDRVLDEMGELGYAGTELGPWGYLPTDPADLRRELEARRLELIGAFCPLALHDAERGRVERAHGLRTAGLLRDLGASTLVLAAAGDAARERLAGRVPRDGSAGLDDAQWARFADAANEIARAAADMGVATAFHPHVATFVETPEEIDRLLALTDPHLVGLCLDTGHVTYGGGDAAAIARTHAARIRHVHAKDVRREVLERARADESDLPTAVSGGIFPPVGSGVVDFAAVIGALRDTGYEGWLVVEQDVRLTNGALDRDPKSNARASLACLRAMLDGGR
ncbi:MAG: TIM barrel protein [Candidatus Limnocylindria bacterium]